MSVTIQFAADMDTCQGINEQEGFLFVSSGIQSRVYQSSALLSFSHYSNATLNLILDIPAHKTSTAQEHFNTCRQQFKRKYLCLHEGN